MAKINTSTIRCSNSNSNINKVQQHQTAKYVDRVQKKGVEDRQSWTPKVKKNISEYQQRDKCIIIIIIIVILLLLYYIWNIVYINYNLETNALWSFITKCIYLFFKIIHYILYPPLFNFCLYLYMILHQSKNPSNPQFFLVQRMKCNTIYISLCCSTCMP